MLAIAFENSEVGIRKRYDDPFWNDTRPDKTIVLGFTDVERQIEYIAEQKHTSFEIELNSASLEFGTLLPRLTSFRNIHGVRIVNAPELAVGDIYELKQIRHLSAMSRFSVLDLGQLPNLNSLVLGSRVRCLELKGNKHLEQIALYLTPRTDFDFSTLASLENLGRLEVYHGKLESLDFCSGLSKLEKLLIAPATRLKSISAIENLKSLEHLHFEKAKSVEDWAVLCSLLGLQVLKLLECGHLSLPEKYQRHIQTVLVDSRKTNVTYSDGL